MYRRVSSGSSPHLPSSSHSLPTSGQSSAVTERMFDRNTINIIILGLSFMFLFTSFQTGGIIQESVVKSIPKDPNFANYNGNGLISVSIIYAVLAVANWLAPAFVGLFGPRVSMIISGLTYCLFTANFLYPTTWGLYFVSVIVGLGAAVIWTAQGTYYTLCSNNQTINRNSNLFWALLQCSFLWGNIFVYFSFQSGGDSNDTITSSQRILTYSVLTAVGLVGVGCFFFLGKPEREGDAKDSEYSISVDYLLQSIKNSFNLFKDNRMKLLVFTFIYTGLELGFFSIVYGATINNTKNLDPKQESSKKYIGLCGILIGLGEIISGLSFGVIGEKFKKFDRNRVVILGFIIHIVAFVLIFLNFPKNGNLGDPTNENGIIKSSLIVALLIAFMLGFADACFNTQLYSIIGVIYSENSSSAFALFKFFQSLACAVALIYSTKFNLYIQLAILLFFGFISTLTFFICDKRTERHDS